MLNYRHADHIGVTDFLRNKAFLETLADLLRDLDRPRVLFHACSVGAEPYSFAIVWSERIGTPIEIEATDIEPEFLKLALSLEHPLLTDQIRDLVTFLPACSVTTFRPVWKNWLTIYYGWRERLSLRPRGKAWKLPYIPFLLAHWRYAGTSIFARELAVIDPGLRLATTDGRRS